MNQKDKDELIKALNDYYRFEMSIAIGGIIISSLAVVAEIVAIIRAIITH